MGHFELSLADQNSLGHFKLSLAGMLTWRDDISKLLQIVGLYASLIRKIQIILCTPARSD